MSDRFIYWSADGDDLIRSPDYWQRLQTAEGKPAPAEAIRAIAAAAHDGRVSVIDHGEKPIV